MTAPDGQSTSDVQASDSQQRYTRLAHTCQANQPGQPIDEHRFILTSHAVFSSFKPSLCNQLELLHRKSSQVF